MEGKRKGAKPLLKRILFSLHCADLGGRGGTKTTYKPFKIPLRPSNQTQNHLKSLPLPYVEPNMSLILSPPFLSPSAFPPLNQTDPYTPLIIFYSHLQNGDSAKGLKDIIIGT